MSQIIWLASYPKSGNTWLRVFFTNLRRDESGPASINDLDPPNLAANRDLFDRCVGLDSDDLTDSEIDLLRPRVYLQLAAEAEELYFCKVHDSRRVLSDGQSLFPLEATLRCYLLNSQPTGLVRFTRASQWRDS